MKGAGQKGLHRKVIREVDRLAARFYLRKKNFRLSDSLIITSSSRSGSSWLMEILGTHPQIMVNWEPIHRDFGLVPKQLELGWYPNIPADNDQAVYRELFQSILSGQSSNRWTAKYMRLNSCKEADFLLTKFVRANNLLPYFCEQFSFARPPIYLVRHPFAVAASQIKAFSRPNYKWPSRAIPTARFYEHYRQEADYLNSLASDLEYAVAIWCLNNRQPMAYLAEHPSSLCRLFYEEIVLQPQKTLEQLEQALGFDFSSFLSEEQLRKASPTVVGDSLKRRPEEQLAKSLSNFSDQQLQDMQAVLDYFSIQLYSANSTLPNY